MRLSELSGAVATALYIIGFVPMLLKAHRTRSLASYSLSFLLLQNGANMINWFYILSLPLGPIHALHAFNSGGMVVMLVYYIRYQMLV